MSIRVLGKGRRERTLPLWKPAAAALRAWLAIRGQVATPEVFVNARGEPLSRWGSSGIAPTVSCRIVSTANSSRCTCNYSSGKLDLSQGRNR